MTRPFIIPYINSQDDIFKNNNYNSAINLKDSPYQYNGNLVPRVTHILSDMLHEDSLMGWSNYIGLYKHQKYKTVLDTAANIGSYVHESIEQILKYNANVDDLLKEIPKEYLDQVCSGVTAFTKWWDIIKQHDYEILMQESPLVCEYYGGTLDLLMKIDGKVYIIDFKTSNHIGYKYYLQLAAYMRVLYLKHNIKVDGCIILQLSKTTYDFNEYILQFDKYEDLDFISRCETAFMSLVYGYYNRCDVVSLSKKYC